MFDVVCAMFSSCQVPTCGTVKPCFAWCAHLFSIWHAQFLWARWWHWLSARNFSRKSSMLKWDHVCGVPIVFCIWHVQFLWPKWWHWLSVRNVSCKSSMLKCTMFCGVPIVFCSGRVDFTQVGRLHAEWVCPCGGLTSRGLGWLNPGAKYVSQMRVASLHGKDV